MQNQAEAFRKKNIAVLLTFALVDKDFTLFEVGVFCLANAPKTIISESLVDWRVAIYHFCAYSSTTWVSVRFR